MKALRAHWSAILILAALAIAVGVQMVWEGAGRLERIAAAVLTWLPVAAWLSTYAYDRIDRVRLAVDRTILWTTNREVRWSLSVEYEGLDDVWLALKKVTRAVDDVSGSHRLPGSGKDAINWTVDGFTFSARVAASGDPIDGESQFLRLELPRVTRGYRGLTAALEHQVGPVLDRLDRDLQAEGRKFVTRIFFPSENPYFGLFVANVEPEAVTRMDISFFETAGGGRDHVRVHRDYVEVISDNWRAVEVLSRRYLGLVPVERHA